MHMDNNGKVKYYPPFFFFLICVLQYSKYIIIVVYTYQVVVLITLTKWYVDCGATLQNGIITIVWYCKMRTACIMCSAHAQVT